MNKRFKIADINKNLRYERISDSFVWLQKAGVASNGNPYTVYACSNNDGGCDYFERKFGEHEHPGILIEATTTAKDIQEMREKRRWSYGAQTSTARRKPIPGLGYSFSEIKKMANNK